MTEGTHSAAGGRFAAMAGAYALGTFNDNFFKQAGLSPLHFIRRVRGLEAIPVLGTGKTDYRALKGMLQAG